MFKKGMINIRYPWLRSFMTSTVTSVYIIAAVFGLYMDMTEIVQRALVPCEVDSGIKGTAYGIDYLVVGISFIMPTPW